MKFENAIVLLGAAQQKIQAAKSIPEVKEIIDQGKAIKEYVEQQRLGFEIKNDVAEIVVRAEYRAGELLRSMKEKGEREKQGGDRKSKSSEMTLKLTDMNISKNQASSWQDIAEIPPEELEKTIQTEKSKKKEITTKSYVDLGKQFKKKKQKKKDANDGEKIQIISKNIDFRLGDFRDELKDIPDGSIDLIITDPPYDKESVYLYEEIARLGKRVLKPNGFLITYSGTMFLPDILDLMRNHLDFYWISALIYPKTKTRVMGRNILQGWKQFLMFQNGFKKINGFFVDVVIGSGREKKNHAWEQSMGELEGFINFFTKENDVILDPMSGSGSTLIVSRKLKRKVIGCEINEDTYNAAKKRLKDELHE